MVDAVSTTFAVHLYAVDVVTCRVGAVRADAELALLSGDAHLVEGGRGDCIIGCARAVGVEAHHGEYGPGRHGARVIIAGNAVWCVQVVLVEQCLHLPLCAPLLSLESAEEVRVGDVGLVGRVVVPVVEYAL